ncbi:MAG TPA: hypothetical protein VG604_01470, partial [Candidatus Saccharimonadales bacterium]|nr:hypothetical protein [Candidatus Saccharimonadales bacterium]
MPLSQIANHEVIPQVESGLFIGHETSHLAVGIVAVGDQVVPGYENELAGYKLLRGNVYALQKKYMPIEDLNEDGTETDADDARSVHFALIENAIESPRVVGAMRLIIKSREYPQALPIEDHYPEAFPEGPAPFLSTEVSRLIARHEDAKIQRTMKWPLFTASVAHIVEHDLGPVFGAVEEDLEQSLMRAGVPVVDLARPKFVEEFNASKMPIRI